MLQVPNGLNGRSGHAALLSTATSTVCFGPDPGLAANANPVRRKNALVSSSNDALKALFA